MKKHFFPFTSETIEAVNKISPRSLACFFDALIMLGDAGGATDELLWLPLLLPLPKRPFACSPAEIVTLAFDSAKGADVFVGGATLFREDVVDDTTTPETVALEGSDEDANDARFSTSILLWPLLC